MKNFHIKRLLKEVSLFLITIFIVSFVINVLRKPEIDSGYLRYLTGETVDGVSVDIFKEKFPLVIHFWGSWCPVCREEASNIDIVSKKYNLLSIAVDSGDDDRVKAWIRERGFSYPVLNDRYGELAKKFKIKLYPTTLIFDKSGELKFIESGYTTTLGLISRIELAK